MRPAARGPARLPLVACLLLLSGARAFPQELLRLEASQDAMGTTFTVALYGEDRERLEAAADAAFAEARRLERMLSNYRPNSELSRVNREAGERPVRVSDELFELLAACLDYSRASEGAFDITVGPLMKVWGFYRGTGRLPSAEEVKAALAKVGYRRVLLDREEKTVRFTEPGVELDPGGIGKGYAVDRMVAVLREHGIRAALISASGSSIYGLGAPPGNPEGWEIRIRHPRDETQTIETLHLKDLSLSTSGSYEKFFVAGGKTYSHIMDPRTGYPAQGVLSVSVLAPRTLDSEAWTKPFFVLGRQWAARHSPKDLRVFLCEDTAELKCAWLP
ncbi:MAG: FAD:protein FMN transferase [Bryobacterales bacterium]|nr:FAD:protein FMN transferase [Bryobacteraceae bacterium]MDW8129920.1 FAD:protein FMN transferase [Bryobacterales bacterium]